MRKAVADPGEGPRPPSLLDQSEAPQGLDDPPAPPPPTLSERLEVPLSDGTSRYEPLYNLYNSNIHFIKNSLCVLPLFLSAAIVMFQ